MRVADLGDRGSPDGRRERVRGTTDIRVLAALSALLVLVVVGIAIAVWLLFDLRRETTDLTEREIEYAAAIGDIALVSKTLANDERGYLISGAAEFRRQFDGRTAQAYEAFARAFANADQEQWEAVNRAQQSFDRWLEASTRDMDVFASGNRDAAIEASLEETRALRKEYEARLSGTQSLANFAIESASDEVSATLGRAVTILMAYLFAALAVGLVIAIWLLRRLAQPIQRILIDQNDATPLEPPLRKPI